MAAPQQAPLPPFFEMSDGMTIRVTAIDPTTGATVAGVSVSSVSIDVDPADVAAAVGEAVFASEYSQGDAAV